MKKNLTYLFKKQQQQNEKERDRKGEKGNNRRKTYKYILYVYSLFFSI